MRKNRLQRWVLFHLRNPKVRVGEKGAFKWTFRRFWLDIETLSGNFKCRFMAAEHPYAYLLAGQDDENIHGFCQMIYYAGMLLTTDQGFVNEVGRAIMKYSKRLEKSEKVKEDETEEKLALEEVKQMQKAVEMPKKERRKMEKDVDRRFKKVMKEAENGKE